MTGRSAVCVTSCKARPPDHVLLVSTTHRNTLIGERVFYVRAPGTQRTHGNIHISSLLSVFCLSPTNREIRTSSHLLNVHLNEVLDCGVNKVRQDKQCNVTLSFKLSPGMPTSPVKTRIPLTSFGHLITEVKVRTGFDFCMSGLL